MRLCQLAILSVKVKRSVECRTILYYNFNIGGSMGGCETMEDRKRARVMRINSRSMQLIPVAEVAVHFREDDTKDIVIKNFDKYD